LKRYTIAGLVHPTHLQKLAKPLSVCITGLLIVSVFSMVSSLQVHAATETPALQTSGSEIVSQNGVIVVLRGVDYSHFIFDPNGDWMLPNGTIESNVWDPAAVNNNLDAIQSWGGNCIRVLTTVQWWTQNTENFQSHLQHLITQAAARGIYVDFVFWRDAASDTQQPSMPYPPYHNSGIITSANDFVNLWANVASTLKAYPNVMFELWNEPNGDSQAEASWFNTTQQCISAIREAGANNLIVVQWFYNIVENFKIGPIHGLDWVNQNPLSDPASNIVYSSHIYRNGFNNDTNSNDTFAYSYSDMIHALSDTGVIGFNKPLWIGEIGCDLWASNLNNEYTWYNNTLTILNQNRIGYCGWAWAPWNTETEWGLVDGNPNYEASQAGLILQQQISASATPAPNPTSSSSPTSSQTPKPTSTPTPALTTGPTPASTPFPSPTGNPTPTPAPIVTPSPQNTVAPTTDPTPKAMSTPTPTAKSTPAYTSVQTGTRTPTYPSNATSADKTQLSKNNDNYQLLILIMPVLINLIITFHRFYFYT